MSDAERVNGWLSRLDPVSEQYPPIVVTRAIARLASPDRAAALRDVETLLRRIHDVTEEADDVVRFYLAGDGAFLRDMANVTADDLAGQIVDRVLGVEQDGGAAPS